MIWDIKVLAVNLVHVQVNPKSASAQAGGGGKQRPNESADCISSISKTRDDDYTSQKNSCVQ